MCNLKNDTDILDAGSRGPGESPAQVQQVHGMPQSFPQREQHGRMRDGARKHLRLLAARTHMERHPHNLQQIQYTFIFKKNYVNMQNNLWTQIEHETILR